MVDGRFKIYCTIRFYNRFVFNGSYFLKSITSSLNNVFAQNMNLLFSIKHPSRVHDVKFCKRVNGEGEVILVGGEDHKTTVYSIPRDTPNPIIVAEMIGHSNRSVMLVGCQSSQPIDVTG